MPTYVYRCRNCHKSLEVRARMNDAPPLMEGNCEAAEGQSCQLEKALNRVYGYVAGAKAPPAKEPEKDLSRPQLSAAEHICSKYCDLHGKTL